jgi:CRP/FNR family cyclic AMP-dependent transcriptional regulator
MKHRAVIDERLASTPLFQGLSKRDLELVSTSCTRMEFETGKVLAREGARGDEFILLLDGAVQIRHDDHIVATRGPDDYIGEIALLTGGPRTATVVTATPVTVEVIARREFLGLLAEVQAISDRTRATMPERLAELAA